MRAEKLIEIINESGDFKARRYSGRGMYGRQCIGVDCGNMFAALATITEMVAWDGEDDLMTDWIELMAATCSDSMGRDAIIYWPRMEWPEGATEEESEEEEEEEEE